MGNSSSKGQGHYTESSNVLREAERIRTQPTTRPATKTESPLTVEATPTHVSATTGSAEVPLGRGFYGRAEGPSAELGARTTPDGGGRIGMQANLGGVGVGHRNKDHDVSLGVGYGWGPGGVQVHGGDMPGATVNAGPITASARSTSFNKPVDEKTAEYMKFMGKF